MSQKPAAPLSLPYALGLDMLSEKSPASTSAAEPAPIVCMSHLRWNFVYQRPQHLMTRFAMDRPVLYVEEAVDGEGEPRLETRPVASRLTVATPVLPRGLFASDAQRAAQTGLMLNRYLESWPPARRAAPVYWYYTPLALAITGVPRASLIVHDCMDELSAFRFAPPELVRRERELLAAADLVFTGGASLYEAKRGLHDDIHAFPSSVDINHFKQARRVTQDPPEMLGIGHPRIGFYGVVDERFDAELLASVAAQRPQWQWIVLGPVVKIDPASLPRADNIRYIAGKSYDELPHHLGSWDVAMMPFAINESTRFISPTKTPEYLAGGRPVVSTPIVDVVSAYGDSGLVHIADGADEFVLAVERALHDATDPSFQSRADAFLAHNSWDITQQRMASLVRDRSRRKAAGPASTADLSAACQ